MQFLNRIVIVTLTVTTLSMAQERNSEKLNMENINSYQILESIKKTELQNFASWFHQDWQLVFPDFFSGTKMYISNISNEQKIILKNELRSFLELHKESTDIELKKDWLRLGAQSWQHDLEIRASLVSFYELIN